MKTELAIIGIACSLLAVGHLATGLLWILPNLKEDHLRRTPFGPPSLTHNILHFTWHIVTVFLVAFGVLFVTRAVAPDADPETLLLRWFAGFWIAATATALWVSRRSPRNLLRFPVPVAFPFIAALALAAST